MSAEPVVPGEGRPLLLKCDSCGVVVHESLNSRVESDRCGIAYSRWALSPSQFYSCEGQLIPVVVPAPVNDNAFRAEWESFSAHTLAECPSEIEDFVKRLLAAVARPALPAPPFNERYTPAMRDLALSCLTSLYAEHHGELEGEQKTAIERYIAYEGQVGAALPAPEPPPYKCERCEIGIRGRVITLHEDCWEHVSI